MMNVSKIYHQKTGWYQAGCIIAGLVILTLIPLVAYAQPKAQKSKVVHASKHDTSKIPLRSFKPRKKTVPVLRERPFYGLPNQKKAEKRRKEQVENLPTPLSLRVDRAVQIQADYQALAMPSLGQNFEGTHNVAGVAPPDTCGDVGPDHYVQAVNLHYQVFDKSGTNLLGPLALNTIWSGFGGACEDTNSGDPIVLYDQWADRWFISQFALDYGGEGFHQCIAVSTTGDPTGTWHRYDYFMSDTIMNDYPKFGIWPDGYYMSINQFDASNNNIFAGQGVAAFDRTNMLAGNAAAMQYFDLFSVNSDLYAMLPSDADGIVQPDSGEPNHFIMMTDDAYGAPQDQLIIYDFHVDWEDSNNTAFDPAASSPLDTVSFDGMYTYGGELPQPGTSQLLDAIGDRLMYRLQYRNFGSHKSMVVNHTVDSGSGVAGIRWYELRDSGSGWAIHQQGTYAGDSGPDGNHRWMGSMAMDIQGNIALGYSITNGSDIYPSIRYTGRLAGDIPLNVLGQGESEFFTGSGSQTGTWRWGDYSMMSVDPVDECTFWYTQEYYPVTDGWDWHTRIGSFKFPGCTAGPTGELNGTVHDTLGTPLSAVQLQVDDGAGIVITTESGADGTYRFAALPEGTYTVTATRYAYVSGTVAGTQIVDTMTTILDFDLAPKPVYTMDGSVTDATTGQGMYARIDYGYGVFWTDPATGMYSADLPQEDYVVNVTSFSSGYDTVVRNVNLNSDLTEDFQLNHLSSCNAPGYDWVYPGEVLKERFDTCSLPTGWEVKSNTSDCDTAWTFDDSAGIGNLTTGNGCFADANSDICGANNQMDTELISPSIDCSSMATVQLEFKYNIRTWAGTDINKVDVSIDGGTSWTTVWNGAGTYWPFGDIAYSDPKTALVDISTQAAGQADVKVRFHYQAEWEYWWQVDDVVISESGSAVCTPPADGGFVFGTVSDKNTGTPLIGAAVEDDSGQRVLTVTTPDDDVRPDGFYMMYLPSSGAYNLTASTSSPSGYGFQQQIVNVTNLEGVAQDFSLPAGLLESIPTSVEVSVAPDSYLHANFNLANTGNLGADFTILEVAGQIPLRPYGPFADKTRHMSPKHLDDLDATGARYEFLEPNVPVLANAGDIIQSWSPGLAFPWGIAYDRMRGRVWLGNIAAAGGDDVDYEYYGDGLPTGRTIDVSKIPQAWMADFAYDMINHSLWQLNVGGENCIHELDPETQKATGDTICPAFGVSQRGLAYNMKTDTFYAGSWNDSTIYEFDRSGTILRSVNVGLPISGLAFNPVTDHLFVMNDTEWPFQVALLDVQDNFDPIHSFAIPGFSPNGGAGLAMDCEGYLWATDKATGDVYQITSGEINDCSAFSLPWLTETPGSGTAAANGVTEIALDFDAAGFSPGDTKEGYLIVETDTPYGSVYVPVTMYVMDLPTVSDITKESAQVSAVVNPDCQSTEYYFEYGTIEGVYDRRTTSMFSSSCDPITIEAFLEGLAPGTIYYVRLVTVNASGATYGPVMTFTTNEFPWLLFQPAFNSQSSLFRGGYIVE